MSITIVETAGSASANSFGSVAEADAYIETRLNSSSWTGTEPKKQALIEATRELSALQYQGYRTASTQALSWPRTNAPDPDGTDAYCAFDDDEIPQRIKNATFELALEFLRAGTTDIAQLPTTAGVIEKTVDVITTRYAEPSQRALGLSRYPSVMRFITPLLESQPGQVRLTR